MPWKRREPINQWRSVMSENSRMLEYAAINTSRLVEFLSKSFFNIARNCLQYGTLFHVECDFEVRLSKCLCTRLIQHANRSLNHICFVTRNI
jgi:hypothetical protein